MVDRLQGEIRGIENAIGILTGSAQPTATENIPARKARGSVKDAVLRLLGESPPEGLKTTDVVDLARASGIDLDRNIVASLLSRLNKDGVLAYDDETRRYRLPPRGFSPDPLRIVA